MNKTTAKQQNKPTKTPIVLTIAGSDSGGGAGIQADIKAISATGSYAASVITAITAQNTLGVSDIHNIPLKSIAMQLDAVLSDLSVNAIKIGMLSQPQTIEVVAEKLLEYRAENIVLDPVMVATSGDKLLVDQAIDVLKNQLIPMADVITPNLHEVLILLGASESEIPSERQEMQVIAKELSKLGSKSVLLKGGHFQGGGSGDLLYVSQNSTFHWMPSERINTNNTHGTGCTLSSAMASFLAQGQSLDTAAKSAKNYIHQAILHSDDLQIGQGPGPVNHFFSR